MLAWLKGIFSKAMARKRLNQRKAQRQEREDGMLQIAESQEDNRDNGHQSVEGRLIVTRSHLAGRFVNLNGVSRHPGIDRSHLGDKTLHRVIIPDIPFAVDAQEQFAALADKTRD